MAPEGAGHLPHQTAPGQLLNQGWHPFSLESLVYFQELEEFLLTPDSQGKKIINVICWNDGAELLELFLVDKVPRVLLGQALSHPAGCQSQIKVFFC